MGKSWMLDEEYPCDAPIRSCSVVEIIEPDLTNVKCSQWSSVNDCIISVNDTFNTLESGYYSINQSSTLGMYFKKEKIELNKLYRLPNEATNIILNDIDNKKLFVDSKSILQERIQAGYKDGPEYVLVDAKGPDHCKEFYVEVRLEGRTIGEGKGRTKKAAEQQAAYNAILNMQKSND